MTGASAVLVMFLCWRARRRTPPIGVALTLFSVRLLSDAEGEVCDMFGVLNDKEVDGVKRRCVTRSTFIIDRQGVVRHVFPAVTPKGHAMEVLRYVKTLSS